MFALVSVLACSAPNTGTKARSHGAAGSESKAVSGGSQGTARIELSQEAAALLQQMITAYEELQLAELDGTIWARFVTEDGQKEFTQKFNSAFHHPNQFKHVLQQDLLI